MSGVLLLTAATLLVLAGAALGVAHLGPAEPLERMLGGATLAVCQVVLSSLLVGALLGRFERGPLLAANAAWDALLLLGLLLRGHGLRVPDAGRALRFVRLARPLEWWQWALVAAAAAALAWRLVLALVLPPFAYDSITYHLTAVADWVQRGRIEPNPYSICCGHYPQNGEVVAAWPALFLHRDTLVDVPQVGFAVLGALAVAALAAWAGVPGRAAAAAGALFALTPIVLAQANVAYVDVTLTAMLLVSLALLVRCLDAPPFAQGAEGAGVPRPALLLPAGLAAGLALGTKQVGLVAAAVLVALVAAHLVRAGRARRLSAAAASGALALFVGSVVLAGGYWYVRNWVEVGNPVWPGDVRVLGLHLFDGPRRLQEVLTEPPGGRAAWWLEIARSWYHDLRFWGQRNYSYEQRLGGLGPVWSWLGWAAVLALTALAARRRPKVALNFVLPLTVIFALQPYRWWSRFTMFLACAGAVAIAVVLEELRGRRVVHAAAATAVVGLAAAGALVASWTVVPGGYGGSLGARRALGLVGSPAGSRSLGTLFFDEYRWLDGVPARATIGVEASAEPIRFLYPLFGPRFSRRVVELAPGSTTLAPGLDYVVVGAGGRYDRAAAAQPAALQRISDERGVRVYRRAR